MRKRSALTSTFVSGIGVVMLLLAPEVSAETAPFVAAGSAQSDGAQSNAMDVEDLKKMRDPFKRPEDIVQVVEVAPTSPLELYASETFKMIAVLTGPERIRAMLLAPDGKTFMVSENTKIGQRRGVVRRITSDRIYIREKMTNVLGQIENVEVELKLQSDSKSKLVSDGYGNVTGTH